MKKILLLFLMLCFALPVFAIESEWLLYYKIDKNEIAINFNPISKQEYSQLTKEQQTKYKKIKKIEKKIQKANKKNQSLLKLYKKNYNYTPLELHYFGWLMDNKDYENALNELKKIKNNNSSLFDTNLFDFGLGFLYYKTQNYNNAVDLLNKNYSNKKIIELKKDDSFKFVIADSFFNLNELDKSLKFANQIKDKENIQVIDLFAKIYYKKNNLKLANYYAKKIFDIKRDFDSTYNLALTTSNINEKIKYFKLAMQYAKNIQEKSVANVMIINIEQEKIKNAIKKSGVYIKEPNFIKIMENCPYGNELYWLKRQDDFFVKTNFCISNYTGTNLKSCFETINEEEEKNTKAYIEEIHRQQQIAVQQQMLYAQQRQNYLIQQQNWALNRPRYSSSTTSRIGNTYYTNTYSY